MFLKNTDYEILSPSGFKSFDGLQVIKKLVVKIVFTDGSKFRCTTDHYLRSRQRDFFKASTVKVGQHIDDKVVVSISLDGIDTVFDPVNVADGHAYMSDGFISHNTSISGLILDEVAFIPPNIAEDFFTSVYPTISSGTDTKIFMLSTPKGYNHFYKFWTEAEEGRSGFVPFSVDWWDVPGRDDAWRIKTISALGSEEAFEQEYNCTFHGSSGTLINGKTLKALAYKEPKATLFNSKLSIFEEPVKDHSYVMTVDGSEGIGLDYATFSIFDVTTLPYTQVAAYRDNTVSPTFMPDIIVKTASSYNNAFLLIELNSTGKEIANICWFEYGYENVAWVGTSERNGQVLFGGTREQQQPGVKTSKMTKRIGCASLKDLLENQKLILNDFHSISELSTFIHKGNSGYAADEQKNDDMVATLWLFAWLTTQGYFRDMHDVNVMREIHNERRKQLDNEILSFFSTSYDLPEKEVVVDSKGIVWTPA